MKNIFYLLILSLFVSCGPCNTCEQKINAGEYDFDWCQGKTIESIIYIDNGNDLIINFTDGTILKLHSNKYDMKVVEI